MLKTYTIATDACTQDIEARNMDEAARVFAVDEFPGKGIASVSDLFAAVEKIGDGAWCWIEPTASRGLPPIGARRDSRYTL